MGIDKKKKGALLVALGAICALDDDAEERVVGQMLDDEGAIAALSDSARKKGRRRGEPWRRWAALRSDVRWMLKRGMGEDFRASSSWRSAFRMPTGLRDSMVEALRPALTKQKTKFRDPLPAEAKLGAFLMRAGGGAYSSAACQLGIGLSAAGRVACEVAKRAWDERGDRVSLPKTESEIAKVMNGLKAIRNLPYCVGAADGARIKWLNCPNDQFYERRRCKGYPSIALFAAAAAGRKFICADIGNCGALGDSAICKRSTLKRMIDNGLWLGSNIRPLKIGDVEARPHLLGDCALELSANMMKTASEAEVKSHLALETWSSAASQARKPAERAFGALKRRLLALKNGARMHHEGDIALLVKALLALRSMRLEVGDDGEDFLEDEDEGAEDETITTESSAGKRARDALLHCVIYN